ncbi:hypothetical protein CUMW_025220 [Citrus unshiu]|nr:hypothetical protein CUMW_025220 [Citrus unshiu]
MPTVNFLLRPSTSSWAVLSERSNEKKAAKQLMEPRDKLNKKKRRDTAIPLTHHHGTWRRKFGR